jgi:very-short-patch-repair endonuclease
MAAVLAAGPNAFLSHLSAAALWEIVRSRKRGSSRTVELPIHVTVRTQSQSRRGIRVHRSRTLTGEETTRHRGIPATTPARTLADLRRTLPPRQFAAALREAEYLGLSVGSDLELDHTRSELESRFLSLCRRRHLPEPLVNARVGPFTVDFLWPEHRLIAELDGYRSHGHRSAFEADRARDVELRLLGYAVVRFTWRQIAARPGEVTTALGRLTT